MSTLNLIHPQSADDRLGLTIVAAIAIHSLIILGMGFDFPEPGRQEQPHQSMEIILVHQRSEQTPEDADYLAQASLDGGGDLPEAETPRSPQAKPRVLPEQGKDVDTGATSLPAAPPSSVPAIATEVPAPTRVIETPRDPAPVPAKKLTAAELMRKSQELLAQSAQVSDDIYTASKQPRHKHINARTQEYKYAAYMESWRQKVERIGNLNYPDEARRRNLSGALILDVSLAPDGSIIDIKLLRSSGAEVLDNAAIHIVRLSAPFAAFPQAIRDETDVLHIIRTWQFMDNNRLSSRR